MCALLNFGLPKGSLEEPTVKLFGKAGFRITKGSRSYTPCWDDPIEIRSFREGSGNESLREDGFFDCGLTGRDWVKENDSSVEIVADLIYSRASNVYPSGFLPCPSNRKYVRFPIWKGRQLPLNWLT